MQGQREDMSQTPRTGVSYSCGSCAYPLSLTSSNRITSGIGSKYRKSIKKGVISFRTVDLSRFTQVDELPCFLFHCIRSYTKIKLLCRRCGSHIGYGYIDSHSPAFCGFSPDPRGSSAYKKFVVKIRALQPSEEC